MTSSEIGNIKCIKSKLRDETTSMLIKNEKSEVVSPRPDSKTQLKPPLKSQIHQHMESLLENSKIMTATTTTISTTSNSTHIDSEKDAKRESCPIDDKNEPLYIMFQIYLKVIENLSPYCLIDRVKYELQGYRDCILKGENKDNLPPKDIKTEEEFYNWSCWKNCSLSLSATAWTTSKFKNAATERYIKIAKDYLKILEE